MTQTLTANMRAHLDGSATSLVLCLKFKRADGTVFAYTEHDEPLTIDLDAMGYSDGDGAQTYVAATGFTRAAFEQRSNLRVPTSDVIGFLDGAGLSAADLRGGKWDLAECKVFFANWRDTSASMGVVPIQLAYLDQVELREAVFQATLRDIMDRLNTTSWISLYTVKCRNILGSTTGQWRCGVQLDPPTWTANTEVVARPARDARAPASGSPTQVNVVKPTSFNNFHYKATTGGVTGGSEPSWPLTLGGTVADGSVTWQAIHALTLEGVSVSAANSNRLFEFTGYTGLAPDDFYRGSVTWLTNNNAGISMEIKSFQNGNLGSPASGGTIQLMLPMPFDIAAGDTFTASAFCSKRVDGAQGCFERFDNIFNHAGEPFSPTTDKWFALKP